MSEQNDDVKLPSLEEIREQVLAFPEIQPVPEAELVFKTTLTTEQVVAAMTELRGKSFSGRHPELGKMVNCQVHGWRHRQFEFNPTGCEQVFTHSVKDKDGRKYEQFREEVVTDTEGEEGPNGEVPKKITLVPDYRTAVPADSKPTMKQIVGAARVAKKRFHPHYSKIKLQFIERTRAVYDNLKFVWNLLDKPSAKASKLERARIIAARQLRKERELSDREYRRRRDQARRINRGLKLGRNRA
jgi:hypothetical protein